MFLVRRFLAEESGNVDAAGNFSIQVCLQEDSVGKEAAGPLISGSEWALLCLSKFFDLAYPSRSLTQSGVVAFNILPTL